ncbi:hypothetical protein [Pseudomonas sp. PS01298]|uniref:hypothetical protein n=1 Tax=Pseudomonas sp. PS01298 TaxID=2991434 RepID=UPI00249B1F72|nr:hypothetical protein [Pseudomonas sp. PS01298]
MPLTKPNQQLRRDFKSIAYNLEQHCIDLGRLASRLCDEDAIALMRLVGSHYEDIDTLAGYAREVKAGRIVRGKLD